MQSNCILNVQDLYLKYAGAQLCYPGLVQGGPGALGRKKPKTFMRGSCAIPGWITCLTNWRSPGQGAQETNLNCLGLFLHVRWMHLDVKSYNCTGVVFGLTGAVLECRGLAFRMCRAILGGCRGCI